MENLVSDIQTVETLLLTLLFVGLILAPFLAVGGIATVMGYGAFRRKGFQSPNAGVAPVPMTEEETLKLRLGWLALIAIIGAVASPFVYLALVFLFTVVVQYVPITIVLIIALLVAAGIILVFMSVFAMLAIWAERRVAGWIQVRRGPNRVGPFGLLQSVVDGIKLLAKEDIVPYVANRFLYEVAPLLVFAGAFIPFVAIPFSQHLVIADMDLGLFYVLAFGALEVVGILMAGWAPNSKWSLYGGMRLAAQMLSYEIPFALSALTAAILVGSLNLTEIIEWQTQGILIWESIDLGSAGYIFGFLSWTVFRSPATFVAFFIFYIASLAETKRAPFDLPEAESELVSGFHTEYTGIRFSYFFLAEYCAMYIVSALAAILFLGGWYFPLPTLDVESPQILAQVQAGLADITYDGFSWESVKLFLKTAFVTGPVVTAQAILNKTSLLAIYSELAGLINLVGKASFLVFVQLWLRWTIPRVRIDQVMHICLKVLLPFSLACLLLAGFQAVISPAPSVDEPEMIPGAVDPQNTAIAPTLDEFEISLEGTETALDS